MKYVAIALLLQEADDFTWTAWDSLSMWWRHNWFFVVIPALLLGYFLINWLTTHPLHQHELGKLQREGELLGAKAAFQVAQLQAAVMPHHAELNIQNQTLTFKVQEILLQSAIAEGLTPDALNLYRSQKATALVDVLVKKELADIELKTLQGKTDIDLDKTEREARTKINMLELAAKVKRELDGHLREDNPGAKP